jgi:hypothetical protein
MVLIPRIYFSIRTRSLLTGAAASRAAAAAAGSLSCAGIGDIPPYKKNTEGFLQILTLAVRTSYRIFFRHGCKHLKVMAAFLTCKFIGRHS